MQIKSNETKNTNFQPGYTKSKAEQYLGVENVDAQAFNVLNLRAFKKNGIDWIHVCVHTQDIFPFIIKVQSNQELLNQLESIETYQSIKFKNLVATTVKHDGEKYGTRYFKAEGIEVL